MEQLLTLSEVSKILGSKDSKDGRFVRELWKKGELNGARVGKRLMFRESDVNEFINRKFSRNQ